MTPVPTALRRDTRSAPLLLLAIGALLSLVLATNLQRQATRDVDAALDADARDLAILFQGLASTIQAELSAIASVTAFGAGSPSIHERFIRSVGATGAHSLIAIDATQAEVVHTVIADALAPAVVTTESGAGGAPNSAPATANEAAHAFVADPDVQAQLVALHGTNSRVIITTESGVAALVATATQTGITVADLMRFDIGEGAIFLASGLTSADHYALYLGDEPLKGRAILASTDQLPLGNRIGRAALTVDNTPILVEVSRSVDPPLSPPLVGSAAVVATGMLAIAYHVALRRRDQAVAALAAAREAEADLARLERELQHAQRMESVGQLAGGVAHDFNNLLAAISATAQLVRDDLPSGRTRSDIQEIIATTERGSALTKRLLAFSTRGVRAAVEFDVNRVVADLEPLLRRSIGDRAALDLSLCDGSAIVSGEPSELEQIVLNLVVNARDACPPGAEHRIAITTTRSPEASVVLTVRDDGAGMSDDVRQLAFEPFFSTKTVDSGSGLGLSIVYGAASRMGGDATIASVPGVGTSVTVQLPLSTAPAVVPMVGSHETTAANEIILLVEDEPGVRRAAKSLMERAGHSVRAVADGSSAIAAIDAGFRPTVLLTDVVLPGGMSGRDVAEAVLERDPAVRVLFASGYPREHLDGAVLDAPGIEFIGKPFTTHTLLDAIRRTAQSDQSEAASSGRSRR